MIIIVDPYGIVIDVLTTGIDSCALSYVWKTNSEKVQSRMSCLVNQNLVKCHESNAHFCVHVAVP
jgi:hypothetical protein